jgi:hypothetical protein
MNDQVMFMNHPDPLSTFKCALDILPKLHPKQPEMVFWLVALKKCIILGSDPDAIKIEFERTGRSDCSMREFQRKLAWARDMICRLLYKLRKDYPYLDDCNVMLSDFRIANQQIPLLYPDNLPQLPLPPYLAPLL